MAYEWLFLGLLLKVPVIYVAWVIYWAIRAEPDAPPADDADPALAAVLGPRPPGGRRGAARRHRRGGPSGSLGRSSVRRARMAGMRAQR
jgi:hypothetical protein